MASEYRDTHKLSRLKALDHLKLRTNNPRIGKEGEIPMSTLVEYMKTKISGGGGGSSFIPNGLKIITESRELQADDAGYALVLIGETPVSLTIPIPSPLQAGESIIIVNQTDGGGNNTVVYEEEEILLGVGEILLFTTTVSPGEGNPNVSTYVSTFPVYGEGGQPNKTALRYLMDSVGVLFPNGVEIVPATRDFQASDVGKYLVLLDGVGLTMPVSAPFIEKNKLIGVFAATTNFPCDNYFERIPGEKVYMYSAGYSAQSSNESIILISGANFDDTQQTVAPANDVPVFINENDPVGYTSKRYLMDNVGNANSYRTEETKTGGTWIDGKPIYRKVLTLDDSWAVDLQTTFQILEIDGYGVDIEEICNARYLATDVTGFTIRSDSHRTSTTINDLKINNYFDGTYFIQIKTAENGAAFVPTSLYLIIEYTKTTDTV